MKNKVLSVHPILGIITFSDLINDLEIMLENAEIFEQIVEDILHDTKMPEEYISTLFNFSVTDSLKWNIDVLKQLL